MTIQSKKQENLSSLIQLPSSCLIPSPTMISLFSGWGGGDYGFHKAGIPTRLAVDFDEHARSCFALNFPDTQIHGWDMNKVNGNMILKYLEIEKLVTDVLLMSPPCQGISLAGKCDPFDERNLLMLRSIKWVIPQVMPKVFIIENVDNLVHGDMRFLYDMILEELYILEKNYGYKFDAKILNSLHYNTPSSRKRLIIMGVHESVGKEPSYPTAASSGFEALTIESVLPEIDALLYGYGFDKLKPNNEFANTITKTPNLKALVNGEKTDLTISQLLKIAGYPKGWQYVGKYKEIWNRIGNSIMPELAYALAMHIRENILCI